MPVSFFKKAARSLVNYYHKGADALARLGPGGVKLLPVSPALVLMELFVAVSLSVNFFYLVKSQCLPKKLTGNTQSAQTFCWFSRNLNLSAMDFPESWRTRVAAPMLSSQLVDSRYFRPRMGRSPNSQNLMDVCQTEEFQQLFGLYHATWLFLTFLLLILFRRDALLLILAVFAGLMYNLIQPAGGYYYPWDMPTLFFFTLACLLFDRGWTWPLLPVIWLGGLVKETTLCCALFILLGSHWNWRKRTVGFLAVIAATLATNRLILATLGVQAPVLAMSDARGVADLFQHSLLFDNVIVLFSLHLDHVAFANVGALLLMMLLPWRDRRDVVFKVVILVFAAGQFLYGRIDEFRIWYELLPLGWLLISDAERTVSATETTSDWWKRSYWLTLGASLALALGTFALAKHELPPVVIDLRSGEEIMQAKIALAESGNVQAQLDLGQTYRRNSNYDEAIRWCRRAAAAGNVGAQFELAMLLSGVRHDYAASEEWYRRAAVAGNPQAQYCLGVIYWDGKAGRQDYQEGAKWLYEAAFHGEANAQFTIGRICHHPPANLMKPDLVGAYGWLKLAQMGGVDKAGPELNACSAEMTVAQIAEAENKVKQVIETKNRTATPGTSGP